MYQLSKKAISQLKQEHRKAKTKWEADRLKAIYLLGIGRSPTDVAEVLLKDVRTILSYYQNYKDGGIDLLLQNNYNGKASLLALKFYQRIVVLSSFLRRQESREET